MAEEKNSIFDLANKFDYKSPFENDWQKDDFKTSTEQIEPFNSSRSNDSSENRSKYRVILFGGIDYYNEGTYGINEDIGKKLEIANEPYSLGLKPGDVKLFNSPLFVNDIEKDIYEPVYKACTNNFDSNHGVLILYGYSWGGNILINVVEYLKKKNISVSFFITVDAAKGPVTSVSLKTSIPSNVNFNLNLYQTNPSAALSRGYPNKGSGVKNVNLTGETNYKGEEIIHSNIDEYTELFVIQAIIYELTGKNNLKNMGVNTIKKAISEYDIENNK